MENDRSAFEEIDIMRKMQTPYLLYENNDSVAKRNIAFDVMSRKAEDILLINAFGFREEAVLAGITEEQIEYIAKNGPRKYKENIIKTFSNEYSVLEIEEIVKVMDEEEGAGRNNNWQRMRNVMRYIGDNQKVFAF